MDASCTGSSESITVFSSPSEITGIHKKRVRKLQESWTHQKTEQLIEEVQMREGIWNYLAKEYRDRNLREAQWQEVATIMGMSRSEVTTKWNSIRCSFRAYFNKLGATKSGQAAGKGTATNPLYNLLKFLEPTLRVEAPTTSNLTKKHLTQQEEEYSASDSENCVPSTPAKRNRVEKDDDGYSKVVERALETLSAASKTDIWDDVGNFVTSNGREWATANPQLANEYKTAIYRVILEFQQKVTEETALQNLTSF